MLCPAAESVGLDMLLGSLRQKAIGNQEEKTKRYHSHQGNDDNGNTGKPKKGREAARTLRAATREAPVCVDKGNAAGIRGTGD
ncbi:hypothetical protein ElyMa_002484300 [Elysia marginata]|uniref:Uncharacterized protein n=1 Tax=Elysia marginata TaxID=1093978 RepID=A0AAV4GNK1_9GAST|nr:hypothetical protein ElyMa_002484300 [Elysia marginata]